MKVQPLILTAGLLLVMATQHGCKSQKQVVYDPDMAPYEIQQINNGPFKTWSFGNVPKAFQAEKGSVLKADDVHFRPKNNPAERGSLCWTWNQPEANITFTDPDAFQYLTGKHWTKEDNWETVCPLSALSFWIYNPEASDGLLDFKIGRGTRVDCEFTLKLNFTGWHHFKALYGRDMRGFPESDADTMTISVSDNAKSGKVYFDSFCTNVKIDQRFVRPTAQAPWIYGVNSFNHRLHWKPEVPEILPRKVISQMNKISARCLSRYEHKFTPRRLSEKNLLKLRENFKKWQIHKSNGKLVGVDVAGRNVRVYWAEAGALAAAFKTESRPEIKAELRDMFMTMCDYFVAIGYGTVRHAAGYGIREIYCRPLLLMKPELKKAGKFEQMYECFRNCLPVKSLYRVQTNFSADFANTELDAVMFMILINDDQRQKYSDLMALRRWQTLSALGYGEIKPDGSLFHHQQPYSGYAIPAINPLMRCVELVNGTVFESRDMFYMAKKIMWNLYFMTDFDAYPFPYNGRWPERAARIVAQVYNYAVLASLTDPETGADFDPEMAAIYMYFAKGYGKNAENDSSYAEFQKRGIKPAVPVGSLSLPTAVALFHRRGDWLAVARGQRKDFLSFETYTSFGWESALGRYMNYGNLLLITKGNKEYPVDQEGSGFVFDKGWNWSYVPGTTTRVLPAERLVSHFVVEEAFPVDEDFAIGCTLDSNGIFGFKLRENPPARTGPTRSWLGEKEFQKRIEHSGYDDSFRARKSWFMFDNRIVALGSDIVNDDKENRTVTTLIQHYLTQSEKKKFILSENASAVFPLKKTVKNGGWLVDKNGDGFYVPDGNDPLVIERLKRASHRAVHKAPFFAPSSGNNELVYFDHGTAPDKKSYEYCAIIGANKAVMDKFSREMTNPEIAPYKVLRKDDKAHVVWDRASATTGSVFFEKLEENNAGPVYGVSKPCLVMVKQLEDGKVKISVADPDFGPSFGSDIFVRDYKKFGIMEGQHMDKYYPAGSKVTIAVRGKWRPAEFHRRFFPRRVSTLSDGSYVTLIDVYCKLGLTESITLAD
jgi:chondroitin-sulfate-ABC endolyase/exolyase